MVSRFSFCPVFAEEVKKITGDLKTNKVVGGEIKTTILKDCYKVTWFIESGLQIIQYFYSCK